MHFILTCLSTSSSTLRFLASGMKGPPMKRCGHEDYGVAIVSPPARKGNG
jgi:hypothetical protein